MKQGPGSQPHEWLRLDDHRRRNLLLALGTTICLFGRSPAHAAELDLQSPTARRIFDLTSEALQLLRRGLLMQALALLVKADAMIEDDLAARWPWRARVGPTKGYALLALGRSEDALKTLTLSLEAVDRVRSTHLTPIVKVLDRHDTAMGRELIGNEFKRQVLSVVVVDGKGPRALEELIWDTSIGSSEQLFNLGRSLLALGHSDKLASVYLERVHGALPLEAVDGFALYAVEHRQFKFAVLLAQAGQAASAQMAFRRAQKFNADRIRESAGHVVSPSAVYGAICVGYRMLSVWVGQTVRPGQTPIGHDQSVELLGAILQLKGLGVRYAERLNALLQTGIGVDAMAAAEQWYAIEDRMAGLPVSQEGVLEMFHLEMQRSLLFAQLLPALRQGGLSDIVVNGVDVLERVRETVGTGAAIGFMAVTPLDAKEFKPAEQRYVRYCITASAIDFRDLGPQAAVDQAIFRFRRELLAGGLAEKSGATLASMLMSNLPKAVSSARDWIVDPDGALALLPFEALPDEKGRMLLLNHQIRYVTSLLQLVEPAPPLAAQGPACVLANPTYPSVKRDTGPASMRLTAGSLRSGLMAIAPLPDTAEEGHSVSRFLRGIGWEVTHMEAAAATAQSLMELKAPPRLLHVASHAVFLDSGVSQNDAEKAKTFVGDAILDMVLPGRRAALVLAGDDAPSVVLAKDFNRLPLRGTQLAVLSACDTGNGDVELGEGLSGLRRALEQAGVASSVTSLWPVPSLATTALMTGFYQRLAQGLTKSHALQLAKQDLMKSGAPPHAWAGFLLSGSDAPLIHAM